MNDTSRPPNADNCIERHKGRDERPASTNGTPPATRGPLPRGRRFDRIAVAIIILFWLSHWVIMSLARSFRYPEEGWSHVPKRAVVTVLAVGLFLLIFHQLRRLGTLSLGKRAALAVLFAFAGCVIHTAVNMFLFLPYFRPPSDTAFGWLLAYTVSQVDFIWAYTALSLMLLALTFADDLLTKQERITALESQTNLARLNALRYQLNPHFLFNTLNAVAGLISSRRNREAEAMVESLSDLLRTTLTAADRAEQIPLSEELELQGLYLEIERIRFPDRMRVSIDLAPDVKNALIPALITQPLIENAIKHGVARSSVPIDIAIAANRSNGGLSIEVRQSGGDALGSPADGTGLGLRNIEERLRLNFGDYGQLVTRRGKNGAFSARLHMPLQFGT